MECYAGSPDLKTYSREMCESLMKTDFELLEKIADVLIDTKRTGATIFTAGNGGSASTASHMINDLTKGCRINGREGFKALCLNDSNALVTCLANDFCYEDIYKILLRGLAKPKDVLVVFSGSGNSENIVRACETAKEMGLIVVGFGGRDGGKMKELCDYCLIAPTYSMQQLEDMHIVYNHALVCHICEKLKTTWDIEKINYPQNSAFKYAIFDFDGTVSLLREGWQEIMYSYFSEEIERCPKAPSKEEALSEVMEFVDKLTGKQTIFQCMKLAETVEKYGGEAKEPLEYKAEYLRRLEEKIKDRHKALENGGDPSPYRVKGVLETVKALENMGVDCYLTSGTDEADVLKEAKLLGVDRCFKEIHGATDEMSTRCSKEEVLKKLINEKGLKGEDLIGFGDGYVEMELTKNVGGYAVAVATNEAAADSSVNEWKRNRLKEAGCDCVIPDFSNPDRLIEFLFRG